MFFCGVGWTVFLVYGHKQQGIEPTTCQAIGQSLYHLITEVINTRKYKNWFGTALLIIVGRCTGTVGTDLDTFLTF